MKNIKKLLLAASIAALLSACTEDVVKPDDAAPVDDATDSANTSGNNGMAMPEGTPIPSDVSSGTGGAAEQLNDPNSPLSVKVFYFDYDSSELSVEDQNILTEHARFLAENPSISLVLEGHADERGSREYNLALGERRAQAIERTMSLQGAAKGQLQVISFGEERPVGMEHDEASWRINRRVELLYSGY